MPPRKRAGAPARKVARRRRVPSARPISSKRVLPPRKQAPPPRAADPFAKKTGRRRTYYTDEFLAEAKRRVEQTAQSMTAIAGNFGMHHSVLARLIEREGWVRPENSGRRRGLSPVMRLAAAADALAASSPPPGGALHKNPILHKKSGGCTKSRLWRAKVQRWRQGEHLQRK